MQSNTRYSTLLKTTAAALLLGVYLFAFLQSQFFHPLSHHHHEGAHCSEAVEESPCHQAIYHGIKSACNHAHFIPPKHDCSLCDVLISTESVEETESKPLTINLLSGEHYILLFAVYDAPILSFFRSRAPPFMYRGFV